MDGSRSCCWHSGKWYKLLGTGWNWVGASTYNYHKMLLGWVCRDQLVFNLASNTLIGSIFHWFSNFYHQLQWCCRAVSFQIHLFIHHLSSFFTLLIPFQHLWPFIYLPWSPLNHLKICYHEHIFLNLPIFLW